MRILLRGDAGQKWGVADPVTSGEEADLQRILAESPELIPAAEVREGSSTPVVAVREFGLPGSGSSDIIAFSPDGDVVLVECKLAANPEIKRKVIGQILEYAAFLWEMTYDEVDDRIRARTQMSLSDLVEREAGGEWDSEAFRTTVEETLRTGAFILIIVVDQINEELRRIVRYVNERSQSAFSLRALELVRYRSGTQEMLVPHLYGVSRARVPGSRRRRSWTEGEFFDVLGRNVDSGVSGHIRELYDWGKGKATRIWFGTGLQQGTFTFHYALRGRTVSVFTISTNGKVTLNYGWLSSQIDQETLRMFHEKVTAISGFHNITADYSKWPALRVADALPSSEDMDRFRESVEWLGDRIREAEAAMP